jgi:hypothetical protein
MLRNIQRKRTRSSNHGRKGKRGDHYPDTMIRRMGMLKLVDRERGGWNIFMMMRGD